MPSATQKHLDREIREMMSAITDRVTGGGSSQHLEKEDEDDRRIITLAGSNDGATMRSELDEKKGKKSEGEGEALSTFVNSNFQAINNSIMLGGSYQANDPGVHLDIHDFVHQPPPHPHAHKAEKPAKKGKKKDKETSKTQKS
ncbi:uncharacterized protein LOC109812739 [Cajanus cajan]|uniref:uncharacterized protein LOC109812739 n=1 Tax=Cajanus cajan TaxID=3821 RepID=UPI00098D78ED|nr:uncharacterized protein LOC109812739 [Cajanus cajan]